MSSGGRPEHSPLPGGPSPNGSVGRGVGLGGGGNVTTLATPLSSTGGNPSTKFSPANAAGAALSTTPAAITTMNPNYAVASAASGGIPPATSPPGMGGGGVSYGTSAPSSFSANRANKPRPLRLINPVEFQNGGTHHFGYGPGMMHAPLARVQEHNGGMDEQLVLMAQINQAVKAGNFSSTLASQIFRLCTDLKNYGEILEQTHKEDMNRVFVSLRQACCRDSGQLGTPCRLKIMELIELRAMGWRPNLAHSQYYIQRGHHDPTESSLVSDLGPAPVSAPPFGTIPMNPFALGFPPHAPNPGAPPAPPMGPPDMVHRQPGMAHTSQPQYYLIPASNVTHTQAGIAFVTPSSATFGHSAAGGPSHSLPPMTAPPMSAGGPQMFMPPTPGIPMGSPPLNSTSPTGSAGFSKGSVIKPSGKFGRPTKVPGKNQYRDEVVIRNADSGKIMGIKGRRIAIIEELSKTIVSFQKVPPGAKERTLTITGSSEENIEQAKGLIDQTIRRNASPTREADGTEIVDKLAIDRKESTRSMPALSDHDYDRDDIKEEEEEEQQAEADIIGLTCANPELLQAAKEALREYFERHVELRKHLHEMKGGGRREEKLERRKSMPPMPHPHSAGGGSGDATEERVTTVVFADEEGVGLRSPRQHKRFQSTPNLAEVPEETLATTPMTPKSPKSPLVMTMSEPHPKPRPNPFDGAGDFKAKDDSVIVDQTGGASVKSGVSGGGGGPRHTLRVVYTREFLLQCSLSPLTQMLSPGMAQLVGNVPDVLRELPGNFDPAEYKAYCAQLKQQQQMQQQQAAQQAHLTPTPPAGPPQHVQQFVFA